LPPGFTIIDLIAVAALMLVLSAIAIPQVLAGADRSKGLAAARFLAARMTLARAQAVSRGATMALVFQRERRGVAFRVYEDGNRNGVRATDIKKGVDLPLEATVRLFELFPGVAVGVTPTAGMDDPIRLGGSDILSFTAFGTSSSGTIYVRGRDGTQWGVRVLGATARSRVLRYIPGSGGPGIGQWVTP
jgi:type II secretory pathway pseudopilin PulG